MSDLDLERIIKNVTIFCRATPRHKLRIVKALQNVGEVVGMTGDGVNDVSNFTNNSVMSFVLGNCVKKVRYRNSYGNDRH